MNFAYIFTPHPRENRSYNQKPGTIPAVPEGTMYDCIYSANKDHLNDIAMLYQGKKISFKQMFSQIDALADAFYANGIRKDDIVSVISLNTPETIFALYALNKIGAVACMELVNQTAKSLYDSIQQVSPKMIVILNLFINPFYDVLSQFPGKVLCISPVEQFPSIMRKITHKKLNISTKISPNFITYRSFIHDTYLPCVPAGSKESPAFFLSTSGSTGIPKKVILTNENLNSVAVQCPAEKMNLMRGYKMLSISPPFLSVGISISIHLPLYNGIILVLCTNPSPESGANMFAKYKPNYYLGALEHILKVVEHKKLQNADLKYLYCCMVGGESMPPATKDRINDFLLSHNAPGGIYIGYAMTECCGYGTFENGLSARAGCVGRPQPSVTVKVRNLDDDSLCAAGESGEVMITSPGVMMGYFNNPDETNAVIDVDAQGQKWLHTGDLGYMNEEGEIFIIGRLKRIFTTMDQKSGLTYKLFPQYVENELNKIQFVFRSAVLVVEDSVRMHIPIAFVSVGNPEENWENMIIEKLSMTLPDYAIPTKFILVDEMPLLSSGKIDYRTLEAKIL